MEKTIRIFVPFFSVLLFSCVPSLWNNSYPELNNPAQFSEDKGQCSMYSTGVTQQQQAMQSPYYGTNKTSAALTGASQGFQNAATSISSFENCMMSKGWYKTQAQQNPEPLHEIERTDNNIKAYRMQLLFEDTPDNKVIVKTVIPGGPADKAGVKPGDIVLSVDENKVTTKEITPLMNLKQKGEHVKLVVERNNQSINCDIEPKEVSLNPVGEQIGKHLRDKEKIVIAIIIGKITNAMPNADNDIHALESWESGIRSNLQNGEENAWLTVKNKASADIANNLSIVDRSRVDSILNELLLSESDFVSDKIRAEIGEVTGATHILFVEFSRAPYQNIGGYSDNVSKRLIDVATGEVLAISTSNVTMSR